MLTVTVVDDLVALLVIATAYSRGLDPFALLLAGALFALVAVLIRIRIGPRVICVPVGVAAWLALSMSGVDPIVIGLAIGLVTFAAPTGRGNLERASELFRRFREQPTPELARSARVGLTSAISQTSTSSNSSTPGRATRSCPCSRLRTPASASTAASSHGRCHRRLRLGS
jgi:Na+/H+ antiporter 1